MPCPKNAGKHVFHDTRWIATSDAQVEVNPNDLSAWNLESGSLICEMRDGPSANARLIAAAPDLLAALVNCLPLLEASHLDMIDAQQEDSADLVFIGLEQVRDAIAKAKGGA